MKKPRKKKSSLGLFYSTYIGEYVEILAKSNLTVPLVIEGFLLEIDDSFYYLSDDGINIVRSVKKEELVFIEIAKVKTDFDEILEKTPMPDRKENGN